MSDTGAMSSSTWTVLAGQVLPLAITGTFVDCIAANLGSFAIAIDEQPSSYFAQGLKFRMPAGKQFKQIAIDNTQGTSSLAVTLAWGIGDFSDQRMLSQLSLLQTLSTIADVVCVAGAATQVAGADQNRSYIDISNLLGNEVPVRVGDGSVGAARGVELVPGQSIQLETTSAVWVWNPHSAAQSVGVLIVEG